MKPPLQDSSSMPVIPDHEMLRRIGSGNYGDVWLARNVIGAFRAVKVVYRATFSDARPFEREFKGIEKYEPVSRSHPGLVQVLQVGRNEEAGYFYYVMELADDCVGGQEFHPDTYSPRTLSRDLMTRGRFEFSDVIEFGSAVAAALDHLHKHGLMHRDIKPSNIIFVAGQPKLADIGLVIGVGESGTMVGTEGYIPPEGPTSPQSDIYSLGKVLYEVSTGNDRNSFPEIPEGLGEADDAEQFVELNDVINKACAPAAINRYATAEELRSDLEVLRAGKSVRRLRLLERRLSLFTRLGIAAGLMIALSVGAIFTINYARHRQQELRALAHIEGGARMVEEGNLHAALPYFAEALDLEHGNPAKADLQRLRIGMLLREGVQLLQVWTNAETIKSVRFLGQGKRLFLAQNDTVQVWEIASHRKLSEYRFPAEIETVNPSEDEMRLVIAGGKNVHLLDLNSGRKEHVWKLSYDVTSAMLSPDGKRLAVGCAEGRAFLFDVEEPSDDPLLEFKGHTDDVDDIGFSLGGERIITASRDKTARVWDVHTDVQIGLPLNHESWVHSAKFSPDGTRIITTSDDRSVRVWDADSRMLAMRPMDHRDGVRRASFSPDMTRIASGGNDETVVLWDGQTGRPLGTKLNHDKPVTDVAFDASGRLLATADYGGTVKIWDLEPVPPADVGNAFFSEDGERQALVAGNTFSLIQTRTGRTIADRVAIDRPVNDVMFSASADRVVLVTTNENREAVAALCEARNGFKHGDWFSLGRIWRIVLSDDATRAFVVNHAEKSFSIWDLQSRRVLYGPAQIAHHATGVFTPDGKAFAVFGKTNLQFIDIASKEKVGAPFAHARAVRFARFSHGASRLLTATSDEQLSSCAAHVWDFKTHRLIAGPFEHDDGVLDARLSVDETMVVTASEDQYASVWSVASGELLMQSRRHGNQVHLAQFGLGDLAILTIAKDTVRLTEARTGYPLMAPIVFPGEKIAAAGFTGTNAIWVRLPERAVRIELVRARQSMDELKELIGALGASQIMRGRGAWSAMEAAQWRGAIDRLINSTRFEECLDDIPRWHEEQALECERRERWAAARFHYGRLVELAPTNAFYAARLTAMIDRLAPPAGSR